MDFSGDEKHELARFSMFDSRRLDFDAETEITVRC